MQFYFAEAHLDLRASKLALCGMGWSELVSKFPQMKLEIFQDGVLFSFDFPF